MGHGGDGIYRKLGEKIDNLTVRAPWDETFYEILRELYSAEEAEAVVRMPYTLSNFERVRNATGFDASRLRKILEGLCSKGLVVDVWLNGEYLYMASPVVVGIFEFTMMRAGDGVSHKKMARLFKDYMTGKFGKANFENGLMSPMRTLPYEEAVKPDRYLEVLDYERAASLVSEADRFSIGICSCRHEKLHNGEKTCDVPLDTCSSFGMAADYLIRNNLAHEVSKTEMMENIARSKEMGLVLNADNVKRDISYICHCCGCCCNPLLGISKYGYPHMVVTSGFVARTDGALCEGCGKCVKACPIGAIKMRPAESPGKKRKKTPQVDETVCLGCGVCALKCKTGAQRLVKGDKKVIYPETTFERVILQCLDKGTLQYQLFDDPRRITHAFMRGLVGGFLNLTPVKRALMGDTLRSTFLRSVTAGARMRGRGWLLEL